MSTSLISATAAGIAVQAAAPAKPSGRTFLFPLDGGDPHEWVEPAVPSMEDPIYECNCASVTEPSPGVYRFELEGSYETLTLEISCGSVEAAAAVYADLLASSSQYQ